MGKLVKRKLNGSIGDSSLLRFGEIELSVPNSYNGYVIAAVYPVNGGSVSCSLGFSSSKGGTIIGTEITLTESEQPVRYWVKNNTGSSVPLRIYHKYGLSQIGFGNTLPGESFTIEKILGWFGSRIVEMYLDTKNEAISGNINELSTKNLQYCRHLNFKDIGIVGNVESLPSDSMNIIEQIDIQGSSIGGSFDSLLDALASASRGLSEIKLTISGNGIATITIDGQTQPLGDGVSKKIAFDGQGGWSFTT